MQTMQNKILSQVEAIIASYGLEAVQQADYANTGIVVAMRGLEPVETLRYEFDAQSFTFYFGGRTERANHRKPLGGDYSTPGVIASALGALRERLDSLRAKLLDQDFNQYGHAVGGNDGEFCLAPDCGREVRRVGITTYVHAE